MRRLHGVLVIALAVRVAAADPREADQLADAAATLGRAGDFLAAAAKFRAAYAADPRPELVCNIGIAYQKAGNQQTRAQLFLSQCLTRATSLDPRFIAAVRKVLVSLEDKLRAGTFTPVDVVVEPIAASVVIDDFAPDEAFVGSRLVWLGSGSHTITVHAEGYVDQTRQIDASSSSQQSVRIVLDRLPEKLPEPAQPIVTPHVDTPPTPLPTHAPPAARRSRVWPVTTSVAAGALGIGAGLVYLRARSHADDAATLAFTGLPEDYDTAVDRAHAWQHASWVLGGAGAVAVGASVFLWYRSARAPRVELGPRSIAVRGGF